MRLRKLISRVAGPRVREWYARRVWRLKGPVLGARLTGTDVGMYLNAEYEPRVTSAILETVHEGWTCADVGAHKGYFSILLGRAVGPFGRVYAFEAHPENAEECHRNLELNGLASRVVVENLAVLDRTGTVTLSASSTESSAEWHVDPANQTASGPQVDARSLDDYFRGGPELRFVKIDVEGAEHSVLKGMSTILERDRPVIIVEFHDDVGWAGAEILRDAAYLLIDLSTGQTIPAGGERAYHCLATPQP